jgi:hypothetical protein
LREGVAVAAAATEAVRDLAAGGLLDPAAAPERAVLTRTGRLMGSDVTARLLLAGAARQGTMGMAGTRYD